MRIALESNLPSRGRALWLTAAVAVAVAVAVAAYFVVGRSTPSSHTASATIRVSSVSSTGSQSGLSSTLLDITDVENTTPVAEDLARTGGKDTPTYESALTIAYGKSDGEIVVTARADSSDAATDLANAAATSWVRIFNEGEAAQNTVLFEAAVESEAR